MTRTKFVLALAALIASSAPQFARATITTGTINNWRESGPVLQIGDGIHHVSILWSINQNHRGWFYGSQLTQDSDVAFAAGVSSVANITHAESLSYSSGDTGSPRCDATCAANGVGDFIVWHNFQTNHYGVLRIDSISTGATSSNDDDRLNGTWWFQSDGSGNFAVPELSTMGYCSFLSCAPLLRRRQRRA